MKDFDTSFENSLTCFSICWSTTTVFKVVMKLKPQFSSTLELIRCFNFLLRTCENFQPDIRRNVRKLRTLREKFFMPGDSYLASDRLLSVSFITSSWFLFSVQTLGLKVMMVLKSCAKHAVRAEMSELLMKEILAWNLWLATRCLKNLWIFILCLCKCEKRDSLPKQNRKLC